MDQFAQSMIGWLRQPDFEDQDKNDRAGERRIGDPVFAW